MQKTRGAGRRPEKTPATGPARCAGPVGDAARALIGVTVMSGGGGGSRTFAGSARPGGKAGAPNADSTKRTASLLPSSFLEVAARKCLRHKLTYCSSPPMPT